jgi:hypothetical protein
MDAVLKNEVNHATIDDTKVGADAWSSRHIADSLCPAFTESGSVAVCEPVEGYPLEVISTIDEKADGSRWDAITLYLGGKNFSSFGREVTITGYKELTLERPIPPGQYRISYSYTGGGENRPAIVPFYEDGKQYNPFIDCRNYPKGRTVTFEKPVTFFRFYANGYNASASAGISFTLYNFQIEAGSTTTEYEPYHGQTFTVDLTNAIDPVEYGPIVVGSYNWKTGVLDTEHGQFQHNPEDNSFTEIVESNYVPPIVRNIPALIGTNAFYSDCGNTTVKGKADPTKIIEKLTNAILALGGNV